MSIDDLGLARTCWNCRYHIAFAPKHRRKAFFGLKEDEAAVQLSIDFEGAPFTGQAQ